MVSVFSWTVVSRGWIFMLWFGVAKCACTGRVGCNLAMVICCACCAIARRSVVCVLSMYCVLQLVHVMRYIILVSRQLNVCLIGYLRCVMELFA